MASSDELDQTLPVDSAHVRDTIAPQRRTPDGAGSRAISALADLSRLRGAGVGPGLVVERTLGQGGMGIIHEANQVSIGRKVAVKRLRPECTEEINVIQLLREAWITGGLEHPNVVPVYDVSVDEHGSPLVVLRRIEGTEWAALMFEEDEVRRRFGARDLVEWNLRILIQVCNALHFAHQRGILHRDVKPDNVMIGELGEVYLLDWGIAVSLDDDGSGRLPLAKDARHVAGTPCYMAPEMWDADPLKLSARTDVYLLGATLYEILTGLPPHQGKSLGELALSAHRPPHLPPELSERLAAICRRALDPDPAARPDSALALRRELEESLVRRDAELLVEESELRLLRLVEELDRPQHDRQLVYNLFGAVRFGFEQALDRFHDLLAARAGLVKATIAMIDVELRAGDPKAALTLLHGLSDPPAELSARVSAAELEHKKRNEKRAELEALGLQYDRTIGQRTRVFLTLVMCTLWTGLPIIGFFHRIERSYRTDVLISVVVLVVIAGLAIWSRDSMSKTSINRALIGGALLAPIAQLVLMAGTWQMGISSQSTEVMYIALWAVLTGAFSVSADRRLVLPAIGYSIAWIVAARWPLYSPGLMAAGNLVLMASLLVMWAPGLSLRRRPQ